MKTYIFVVLMMCSTILSAQNWNTIVPSDTIYFSVEAPAADSLWEGYLRCIWVDSTITTGIMITNHFYESIRLDANGITDTAHGDTWLGNKNTRDNSSGEETFYNQINEPIVLKTWANMGDTWVFSSDSNGLQYQATVVGLDTLTIDGLLDSIKTIQVQATIGGVPTASIFNAMPIVISKQHGFYSLFEIYGFPYTIIPTEFSGSNFDTEFPFPILPFKHQRIEREMTERNYLNVDLNWKYSLGNEWQFLGSGVQVYYSILHDSVMSYTWLGVDSMKVTLYKEGFYKMWLQGSFGDTSFHISQSYTDTFNNREYAVLRMITPEHKSYASIVPNSGYTLGWIFIDMICDRLLVKDTSSMRSPVSGRYDKAHWYLEDFGPFGLTDVSFQINAVGGSNYPFYYKLGSCTGGTKIDAKILDIDDLKELANKINVFPNPTFSMVHIDIQTDIDILELSVLDIQGKKLFSRIGLPSNHQVDISDYPSGIYFLELKTNKGIINKKIVKY